MRSDPAGPARWPGPAHLLGLSDEIPLEEKQVAAIESLFKAMRDAAIPTGERLPKQSAPSNRPLSSEASTKRAPMSVTRRRGGPHHIAVHTSRLAPFLPGELSPDGMKLLSRT